MALEYASVPDGVSVDITIDPKGSLKRTAHRAVGPSCR